MDADANRSFLSLFSGAGGLDLGLEQSGWRGRFAIDVDADSVASLRGNQGKRIRGGRFAEHSHIEHGSVEDLTGEQLLKSAGARCGEVPLMIGGPPCQSWSSAGAQRGFEDPRGVLFRDFVRLADECGCKLVLFENVRGMLTARGPKGEPGGALRLIRETLFERGYYSSVALLNAADFGAPQRRVRLFIIGFRDCGKPSFPLADHQEVGPNELAFGRGWIPMSKCLLAPEQLGEDEWIRPSGKMGERLKGIPPGSGVKSPGKAETTRPGGHWGYMQGGFVADPSLPARTVTASSQQDWILLGDGTYRRLCPRECAALQTFPKSWKFIGKRASQYRQIGNAVPPKLAVRFGEVLWEALQGPVFDDADFDASRLPRELQASVNYTKREEARNGESRRRAKPKRKTATK